MDTKTAEEMLERIKRSSAVVLESVYHSWDDLTIEQQNDLWPFVVKAYANEVASPLKKRIEELEGEAKTNDREMQKLYELIHFWSKESHKWRDCFVTLSRFDSSKHLFSKLLSQAEEYLGDYPRDTALTKDKLSSEETI